MTTKNKMTSRVEVEYWATLNDGTAENFRCRIDMAKTFAANPEVRFACLLGRCDGIPCVLETLRGKDRGPDYDEAKTFAQENL